MIGVNMSRLYGSGRNIEVYETRKGIQNEKGAIVQVEVTQNGQDYSESGVTFEYSAAIVIDRLDPSRGPLYGGTEVLVWGKNFKNLSSLACRFGTAESAHVYATRFVNTSAVICISPPVLKPGPVELEVSNSGGGKASTFSSSRVLFTYNLRVRITGVYPPLGPASGNFSVRITGGPFVRTSDLRCKFGEVIVRGVFVDGEEMNCFAPMHDPGQYALEVSLNDQDYTDQRFPFLYYDDPAMARLAPVSGPAVAAGTPVTIYGNGFVNTSLLTCRFGRTVVPASFRSSSEILCHTPPLHPDSGGLTWTALSEQRNRHPDPRTGSRLLFPEAHFYPLYLCRLVSVEISNNGQDYTDSGITFLYQGDARVQAVSPNEGTDVGNTGIFVLGENFVNSSTLRCRFGPYVSPGAFLSRQVVLCFTPARATREPQQGFLADGLLRTPEFGHAPSARTGPFGAPPSELFVEISNNAVDYTSDRKIFNVRGPCPTGYFCSMNDIRLQMLCPRGTYCPGEGNTNFTLCPRGTYQPNQGQSSCFRCPIGFVCPEFGMHVPRLCPAGMFRPANSHMTISPVIKSSSRCRFRLRRDGHRGGEPAVPRGPLLPGGHGHHGHHLRAPPPVVPSLPGTVARRAQYDASKGPGAAGAGPGARRAQLRLLE
jgi:hypothetical protein